MQKILRNSVVVVLLTLLLLAVPKISGLIASLFSYQSIDPDKAYAWISVHHIVQAVIFLILMLVLIKVKSIDFKLGLGNKEIGKKYVLRFSLIFGVGSLVSHVITIVTNSFQPFPFPLTFVNITGYLGFQLLLSGPSEELIFRAFAITMLTLFIGKRLFNNKVSSANLIAAVIFGLAHVGFSFFPFELTYHPYQIVMSIVLGFFYGDCYEKSNSVVYPMMMHSISNVIMVGLSIIATFFLI